jgi:hypothetical protein
MNNNEVIFTPYNFTAESIRAANYSHEELIQHVMTFQADANKKISTLIAMNNNKPADPSFVDTNNNNYKNVFNHEKIALDTIGVNQTCLNSVNKKLARSTAEVANKKSLYETAGEKYHQECVKNHVLSILATGVKKAVYERNQKNIAIDEVSAMENELKKRKRQIRASSSSISYDKINGSDFVNPISIKDESDEDDVGGNVRNNAYVHDIDEEMSDL